MRNIWKIFKSDIHNIRTQFFALVIAGGILVLPALYAWFNIYANWDPYANTGQIEIAVASLDSGYTDEDGNYTNMGDNIKERLSESTSIGWVFLDTEEEVVEGVYAGDYYAAVVIEEDFSESMYTALTDNFTNPKITYYENEKKNAVATKITDTAVDTLKQSINQQFIKVITEQLFTETNILSEELEGETTYEQFLEKLNTLKDNLDSYGTMLNDFVEANTELELAIATAQGNMASTDSAIEKEEDYIDQASTDLSTTKTTLDQFHTNVNTTMTQIQTSLSNISTDLDQSNLATDAATLDSQVNQTIKDADQTITDLNSLITSMQTLVDTSSLSESDQQLVEDALSTATTVLDGVNTVRTMASSTVEVSAASDSVTTAMANTKSVLASCSSTMTNVQNLYNNTFIPQMNGIMDSLSLVLDNVSDLLDSLDAALGDMDQVFDGITNTVDSTNESLENTAEVIDSVSAKLEELIEKLEAAGEEEWVDELLSLLGGDPESYGEFFSNPVTVETNAIYPVDNYGSAVAPFYTALAIWVGTIFLVAIFKVKVDPEGLDNPKSWQLYFGRYLLFFLFAQLQALIITIGDLYLLKVQCLHPGMFFFATSVTAFVFSLLIYTLTISFGDIGKALTVVMVVIQIAGSSGTYPIELLPDFYQKIYLFFPFPYAINAMRECVAGIYENTYGTCLSILLIFAAISIVIGLVVRIPLVGFMHFMEERMEDTKMM